MAQVAYNGYGKVLANTLTPALAEALEKQGLINDPATGLTYLGNGRYYDPNLGRPLQPNPAGGAPAAPQSLNRYAATPLGQPGVAESTGGLGSLLPDTVGVIKTLTIDYASDRLGRSLPVVVGYLHTGQVGLDIVTSVGTGQTFVPFVEHSQRRLLAEAHLKLQLTFGLVDEAVYAERALYLTGQNQTAYGVAGQTRRRFKEYWSSAQGVWINSVTASTHPLYGSLDSLRVTKLLREGAGFGLDIAISAYLQYLEDMNNPYLTRPQKISRVAVSGGGAAVFAVLAAGLFCGETAGLGCLVLAGIGGDITWSVVGQPLVFSLLPGFQPADRNLKPLSTP